MNQRDPRDERMDHQEAGEDDQGQLARQTPGLDTGETSAIAGPDWDPELVREAAESMPGPSLEGEVEEGGGATERQGG